MTLGGGGDCSVDEAALARCLGNADAYAERLGAAIRCKTISSSEPGEPTVDRSEMLRLHAHLEQSFPRVHAALTRRVVNEYSLLYEWRGSADASELPYLISAHLDVVPVEAEHWSEDPFGGEVKHGSVWGRGAIDDKQAVMGHLEAVEDLLAHGFTPRRTVYFAFGHDEEQGGEQGAKRIASLLASEGVTLEFLLDEGLFVIDGVVPSFPRPVAMICVAEKGNLCVELTVEAGEAGHSSAPPKEGAISILADALVRLHRAPFPAHADSLQLLFGALRGGFKWPMQMIVSNLWLFMPLLRAVLASKPKTATLVRTTTALTVIRAGSRSNVLPVSASAVANFRIHPADSVTSILARLKTVIRDERVKLRTLLATEPSPVSSPDHPAFADLAACVRAIFPSAAVAPGLFVAASDSKHYWNLAPQIFRFNPVTLHKDETSMFHGHNERISVRNHAQCVAFFRAFHLKQSARSVPRREVG